MIVEDVVSKITNVRKIIGAFQSEVIEFHINDPLCEPVFPNDIVNVLEEYIYLLNHLKVVEQTINYRICKGEET